MPIITYFQNVKESGKPHLAKEETAYERIKDGKSKAICEALRASTDKAEKDRIKRTLPAIIFQGEFSERTIKGLKKHSGLVVLDFDHLGERLADFLTRIKADKYTRAAFISPSGDGVKVVVRIPASAETHKLSCKALFDYYKDESLDPFEDVSRLCFESYDPNIFAQDSEVFETLYVEKAQPKTIRTKEVNTDIHDIYEKLKIWLEKTETYGDGNKHNFIVKLSSACNRFGIPSEFAIDAIFSDYQDKASAVDSADFERIINRVYKNYAHQYSTSFFDKQGEAKDNDDKVPEDVFSDKVKDVIYLDSIRDRMLTTFKTGENQGETTFYETIDPHFKLKKKEVTLHGGAPNAGKSTMELLLICMPQAMRLGKKIAVFSPEQDPPDYFYNDLIHTYLGKPVEESWKRHQCTIEEYQMGMEFVKEHFFYLYPTKSPKPEYINDRFLEAKEKHGVEICVIDPFNQLDHDWGKNGRDDRYISSFLDGQKRFASDNDVYMHILAHPNASLKKKADGNYEAPDMYDFAGGAMWGNKCDNIIVTYRPYYSTDKQDTTTIFKSLKIKKQKLIGIPGDVNLTFDRMSNRYMEEVMGVKKNPFGDYKPRSINRNLNDPNF